MLRTARNFGSNAVFRFVTVGKDRTVQSEKESVDINFIMKKFGVTGLLPQVELPPTYQEFQGVFDFQSAMNLILKAKRSFERLPHEVRTRFGNDPGAFVAFCEDENNLPELRKMGLAVPEAPPPAS